MSTTLREFAERNNASVEMLLQYMNSKKKFFQTHAGKLGDPETEIDTHAEMALAEYLKKNAINPSPSMSYQSDLSASNIASAAKTQPTKENKKEDAPKEEEKKKEEEEKPEPVKEEPEKETATEESGTGETQVEVPAKNNEKPSEEEKAPEPGQEKKTEKKKLSSKASQKKPAQAQGISQRKRSKYSVAKDFFDEGKEVDSTTLRRFLLEEKTLKAQEIALMSDAGVKDAFDGNFIAFPFSDGTLILAKDAAETLIKLNAIYFIGTEE